MPIGFGLNEHSVKRAVLHRAVPETNADAHSMDQASPALEWTASNRSKVRGTRFCSKTMSRTSRTCVQFCIGSGRTPSNMCEEFPRGCRLGAWRQLFNACLRGNGPSRCIPSGIPSVLMPSPASAKRSCALPSRLPWHGHVRSISNHPGRGLDSSHSRRIPLRQPKLHPALLGCPKSIRCVGRTLPLASAGPLLLFRRVLLGFARWSVH